MRRLAVVGLCALLGALSTPRAAAADDYGPPLRAFCMTGAHDYCVRIFNWESIITPNPPGFFGGSFRINATLQFFGAGYASALHLSEIAAFRPGLPQDGVRLTVYGASAGFYDVTDNGIYESGPGFPTYTPGLSVYDITEFYFFNSPTEEGFCRPVGSPIPSAGNECVEIPVPEPGTSMLLASGVLGIGWVARRRKRQAA